jgi:mono/diheme cytochrome c family protein
MPRGLLSLLSLFVLAPAAFAQGDNLNDQQKLGRRLFDQSCVVCHLKPQLTSGQYGPVLSKDSLSGKADVMHEVISNGSPHMPGFKLQFSPDQIDAIIAYLKTVPAPPAQPAPAAKK